VGDEKPSCFCGGRSLEVSTEAATPTEPRESAFDDPTPRQELEAFDAERPLDNLDAPRSAMGERGDKLFAPIHPVGKDMSELRKAVAQALQERDGAMNVLHIRDERGRPGEDRWYR